jgi:hypothetical protein
LVLGVESVPHGLASGILQHDHHWPALGAYMITATPMRQMAAPMRS